MKQCETVTKRKQIRFWATIICLFSLARYTFSVKCVTQYILIACIHIVMPENRFQHLGQIYFEFEKLSRSGISVTRTQIKYIMLSKVSVYFSCNIGHIIYFNNMHIHSYAQKTFSTFGANIFRLVVYLLDV